MAHAGTHRLEGTRILLIEDEYYIADDVRRILVAAGAEVVGPVGTLETAEAAVRSEQFDCALVDLNLHGESAAPLAERMAALDLPLAITTGYGSPAVPEHLQGVPRIEKPYDPSIMVDVVHRLTATHVR